MPGSTHLRRRASLVALTAALLAGLLPIGAPGVTAVVPTSQWYEEGAGLITSNTATFASAVPAADNQVANVTVAGRTIKLGTSDALVLPGVGTYDPANSSRSSGAYIQVGPNCSGRFVIWEVTYNPDNSTATLAADWRTSCSLGTSSRGSVRFNSSVPFGALSANPATSALGTVTMNSTTDKTVVITNVGATTVTISAFSFVGGDTSWFSIPANTCVGVALAPAATCSATVRIKPLGAGSQTTYLRAASNATLTTTELTKFTLLSAAIVTLGLAPTTPVTGGKSFYLKATLSPSVEYAKMEFYVDGVLLSTVNLNPGNVQASITVAPLTPGWHTAEARYKPTGPRALAASKSIKFVAMHPTTTSLTTSTIKTYADQKVTLSATVNGPAGMSGGTIRIYDLNANQTLGTLAVTSTAHTLTISTVLPGAGTWRTIIADYAGSPYYAPSTAKVSIQNLADTDVVVNSTSISPATFYPYVDSYLDTTTIGGSTGEPANVQISIYRSTGSRVAFVDLGTKSGAYSYVWNGRNASGTMFPADTYRVEQRFADGTGHVKVITGYVVLSPKILYTYTTYVTKTASQYAVKYASWAGWELTLPSATIYKSLAWQVDGKTTLLPVMSIGAWDFRNCTAITQWSPGCANTWTNVPTTRSWVSLPLSTVYNRDGRIVRGFVSAYGSGVVYNVRVKVVYGVLK